MKEINLRVPGSILKITAAATLLGGIPSDTRPSEEFNDYSVPEHTMKLPAEMEISSFSQYPIETIFNSHPPLEGPQQPPPQYWEQRAQEEIEQGLIAAIEQERLRLEAEKNAAPAPTPASNTAEAASSTQPEPVYSEGQTVWDRLVICEASGNWAANTGNGFEGGLQFLPSTWLSFKDSDMPVHAYEATREQQIIVAEQVLAAQGWETAWPGCSAKLGIR